ncbi:MAG: helix-turn-helix domain-containing protein [Steroidobacteraceae bacterium]
MRTPRWEITGRSIAARASIRLKLRTGKLLAAWISRNLQQRLSAENLAKRAHLGTRHFSRSFKEAFAMTPAEFVERQRMKESCRRLLLPRAGVQSVAASVGFKSADAFRRAFERRFGVAPSQYRARFGRISRE